MKPINTSNLEQYTLKKRRSLIGEICLKTIFIIYRLGSYSPLYSNLLYVFQRDFYSVGMERTKETLIFISCIFVGLPLQKDMMNLLYGRNKSFHEYCPSVEIFMIVV